MAEKKDCCGAPQETKCGGCADALAYWCESCHKATAEKRCPLCGLKTRRARANH